MGGGPGAAGKDLERREVGRNVRRMADDLATVLTLLHDSDRRWRALRAEGDEWIDPERSREAFLRSVRTWPGRGSAMTSRGTPAPADRDPNWKVWRDLWP